MKKTTTKLMTLLALVFTMSYSSFAQVTEICNDPAACNYQAVNNNEPCIYIVTPEMNSEAQSAFDAAQLALQYAQEALVAASSARSMMQELSSSAELSYSTSQMSQLAVLDEISVTESNMNGFVSDLEGILTQLSSETLNLSNIELDLDLEEVAMAAANLALQGAQEYLAQAQLISDAALADFTAAEFENFDAGQAVNDAWEAYNFAGNLQDNALEALGVAQLEEEATQYALDLGVSALNAASEELINALGAIGLAEEAAAAKAAIVASANLAMEGAQAALALAQQVSDVALMDFTSAQVENFDLATAMTDALNLQTFYQDALDNALEELGIAQLQQESTQYAADLAASALDQASEELIGALGAIGLAEEATAAKAAILSGANLAMDAAQDALDIAQSGVDLANAAVADAYSGVSAAQSALDSENALTSSTQYAWNQAQNYYNSLELEFCTYTPEVPAVWTPAVESYIITPAVPSYLITSAVASVCTGGYYQTLTPAVPAVTLWVPELCLPWPISSCTGGEYETITPAIPATTTYIDQVCTPSIPAVWSPSVPAVWSPYIPSTQVSPYIASTNICVPNPEVAIAFTAIGVAATPYYAAQVAMDAAQLALTGVLATQAAAQVVVDQASSVLNGALSTVADQIAVVQNAQGDLDLAAEAENNANTAYQAAQNPHALAADAEAFANDAAALALETAGDWQDLVAQNTGNALAALNTYEATAPLAEAAEIALEGAAAAAEIANSELNDRIQEQADKIAMLQNAQGDLDLAEEAQNNANVAYQAAQDPEAAAQAAADLAQTAANHAVSVVASAQELAESGAGNLLALLNDYEALAPLADLAEATLDLATTAMAEANAAYSGMLDNVSSELATVQTHEYSISELTTMALDATELVSELTGANAAAEAMISTAEASITLLTGQSLDLEALVLEAANMVLATTDDLVSATNQEAIVMVERDNLETDFAQATMILQNNTMSGPCAVCEIDADGVAYIDANDADNDGVCDVVAIIAGCTDALASNYNAAANPDDGSCISWEQLAVQLQVDLDAALANQGNNMVYVDAFLDLPEGWSMFGYSCMESVNAIDAFLEISESILIVKDEMGLSYLPEWGFNALGRLEYSEGYKIKLAESVTQFQFCTVPVVE